MAEEEEAAPSGALVPTTSEDAREADSRRSEKRARQFKTLLDTHRGNVRQAVERSRVRLGVKWSRLSDRERKSAAELRRQVGMANRAYHLAVRRLAAEHRAESGPERPSRPPRQRHPSRALEA